MIQYIPTGTFYGRVKINGRLIRRSLETAVFTTAKLRLADFLKEQGASRTGGPRILDTFKDARLRYEEQLEARHDIKESSKLYRRNCLKALLKTWPELDGLKLEKFTFDHCQAWAGRFTAAYDEQFFNNTLGTLRAIFDAGGRSGNDNPARLVKRLGVKVPELKLPEPNHFQRIIEIVETAGAPQSKDCANFIHFLAYSGCRLSEARSMTWERVDSRRGVLIVPNAKLRPSKNHKENRDVPIIPEMKELLDRLGQQPHQPAEKILAVGECEKSLTRACRLLGIPRITHHDLRHLFATRCIESGVDIPTVSRWLGHVDGGALAMRVYGHLRDQHSTAMAAKVTFKPVENIVPMPKEKAV